MRWRTENLTGMKVIFTHHAKKRIGERYTGVKPIIDILQEAKPATAGILKHLQKQCPGHKVEFRRKKYRYWYQKKKSEKLWRVFVTKPERCGRWVIVTFFEIDYSEYYKKNIERGTWL